ERRSCETWRACARFSSLGNTQSPVHGALSYSRVFTSCPSSELDSSRARKMAQLTKEGTPPQLAFGRLRFQDDLESSFSDYFFEHSLPFARFAIVLAIVLYALFGILDLFIAPDVAGRIWVIRYAILCPVALAVLVFTFTRWFKRAMQPILSALAAVCGLGIVAMIAIAKPSAGYLYYAGLLLVIPCTYTLLQLRDRKSTRLNS